MSMPHGLERDRVFPGFSSFFARDCRSPVRRSHIMSVDGLRQTGEPKIREGSHDRRIATTTTSASYSGCSRDLLRSKETPGIGPGTRQGHSLFPRQHESYYRRARQKRTHALVFLRLGTEVASAYLQFRSYPGFVSRSRERCVWPPI